VFDPQKRHCFCQRVYEGYLLPVLGCSRTPSSPSPSASCDKLITRCKPNGHKHPADIFLQNTLFIGAAPKRNRSFGLLPLESITEVAVTPNPDVPPLAIIILHHRCLLARANNTYISMCSSKK
jgi:hypothetical protein